MSDTIALFLTYDFDKDKYFQLGFDMRRMRPPMTARYITQVEGHWTFAVVWADVLDGDKGHQLILFVALHVVLFHGTAHLAKYKERKRGHPLFLIGCEGRIKWLPCAGQLFKIG